MTLIAFRRLVAVVMTCACLLLPGCMCNSVAGTYADSEHAVTIELRSDGKAFVSLGDLGTNAGEWEQDGDRILLKMGSDTTVLTRKDDGSLDGGIMLGTLRKKA